MLDTVKRWVPITHAAFLDYRIGAVHVSAKGKKLFNKWSKAKKFHMKTQDYQKESGMS